MPWAFLVVPYLRKMFKMFMNGEYRHAHIYNVPLNVVFEAHNHILFGGVIQTEHDFEILEKIVDDYNLKVIVDNSAFIRGEGSLKQTILAARYGFHYILPDKLEDADRTFELHYKLANILSDDELKRGLVVLQGRNYNEMMNLFDRLKQYGIVKHYIAIGGPKATERLSVFSKQINLGVKSNITLGGRERLAIQIYNVLKGKYWIHVLGVKTKYADSFDVISPFLHASRNAFNKGKNVVRLFKMEIERTRNQFEKIPPAVVWID